MPTRRRSPRRGSPARARRSPARDEAPSSPESTNPSAQVEVITYNLLSNHLTRDFHGAAAADLDGDVRLNRIKDKLLRGIRAGAVLCLQEVSQTWAVRMNDGS